MDYKNSHWSLIQKFISGNEIDEEEHKILNEWMDLNPKNQKLVKDLKEIWELAPSEKFEVDIQSAWFEFQRRQNNELEHAYSAKNSKRLLYILRVAAIVLVSMFAGVFMQYTFIDSEDMAEFYVMQTFETDRGEKASITFSDGTEVILNSKTSINFPKEFQGMAREIYLDGEAYFKVAKNLDMPFIVYAKDTEVNVLGTEFNVQAWEDDSSVRIAVSEGEVAVSLIEQNTGDDNGSQSSVVLKRGFYTAVIGGVIESPIKLNRIENHLMWVHGGLYFENEPFTKVIRDIERRFDVNIKGVDSNLLNVPFTGRFQYADLDEVLDVIAASMNFDYHRSGTDINIL